jgi:hypothetical protein
LHVKSLRMDFATVYGVNELQGVKLVWRILSPLLNLLLNKDD